MLWTIVVSRNGTVFQVQLLHTKKNIHVKLFNAIKVPALLNRCRSLCQSIDNGILQLLETA